jgi:hypothetical protein
MRVLAINAIDYILADCCAKLKAINQIQNIN